MTPWRQLYFTWWRMPEQEYNIHHKWMPYYILGQIDYSKEILIPKDKVIDGITFKGFDVINPLYCYEGGRFSFKRLLDKQDPALVERAAIIINRGWIPYEMKDRRTRPKEINTFELKKVYGTWRKGQEKH